MENYGYSLPILLLLAQIIFAFLFGFHSEYKFKELSNFTDLNAPDRGVLEFYYPFFMDVHIMIIGGFGFLMVFLQRYSFSSIGFNLLLCGFTAEWALIIQGYLFDWDYEKRKFFVDAYSILGADFTTASVLISMGAVLGKVNAPQLIVMAFFEIPIQITNKYISSKYFCASDAGQAMYVHMFGAYFGLAVAFALYRENASNSKYQSSHYTSDTFTMIGTIVFFCFWPSGCSAALTGVSRIRAVINTYISMSASVMGSYLMSSLLKKGKLRIAHIQSSTLAGGVAISTVAGSNIGLHGGVVIGSLAGIVSVLGFEYLIPLLKKIRIHDTCGIHYLHGLPAVMSAITGIIVASMEDVSGFSSVLHSGCLHGGTSRDPSTQSALQAAAFVVTFATAIITGLLVGVILRILPFSQKEDDFDDEKNWYLPDDYILTPQ